MFISRQRVLAALLHASQAGILSPDGPTSLFLMPKKGKDAPFARPVQLSVAVCGDTVTVRTSRLPFVRPMVFTMEEILKSG